MYIVLVLLVIGAVWFDQRVSLSVSLFLCQIAENIQLPSAPVFSMMQLPALCVTVSHHYCRVM